MQKLESSTRTSPSNGPVKKASSVCGTADPRQAIFKDSNSIEPATGDPQGGRSRFLARLLGLIGLALSPTVPLDPVLNVPIAYGMGWLAAKIYPPALMPVFTVVLFATNLLGSLMMRVWGPAALGHTRPPYTALHLVKDLGLAAGYMAGISVLTKLGVFAAALTMVKHLAAAIGITPAV